MPKRRLTRRLPAVGAVVALAALAGPYAYIHFVEGKAPKPLSLSSSDVATAPRAASAPPDGTWKVASGSEAGYRVGEVLFGQNSEAVGRTSAITGTAEIAGTTLKAATFSVDMTTVKSDQERRDRQFQGRIMQTATYPNASFTASGPTDFGKRLSVGSDEAIDVGGQLTLHGTTRPVTLKLKARYTGSTIDVSGSLPIVFGDWNIPNPSFAGFVTTQDHGVMEILVHLAPA